MHIVRTLFLCAERISCVLHGVEPMCACKGECDVDGSFARRCRVFTVLLPYYSMPVPRQQPQALMDSDLKCRAASRPFFFAAFLIDTGVGAGASTAFLFLAQLFGVGTGGRILCAGEQ